MSEPKVQTADSPHMDNLKLFSAEHGLKVFKPTYLAASSSVHKRVCELRRVRAARDPALGAPEPDRDRGRSRPAPRAGGRWVCPDPVRRTGHPRAASVPAQAGEAARVWGLPPTLAAAAQPGGRSAGWSLGAGGPGGRRVRAAGGETAGRQGRSAAGTSPRMHPLAAVQAVQERLRQSGKRPEGQRAKSSASPIPPGSPGRLRCSAGTGLPGSPRTGLPGPPRDPGARDRPSSALRRPHPAPSRSAPSFSPRSQRGGKNVSPALGCENAFSGSTGSCSAAGDETPGVPAPCPCLAPSRR
ncbi:translation initiation factor IF-2-like [Motacilla alba alba]|uniref:translation initiation factor IF-2-like n=1 Tax=Motacilla alba alba TaxID=1094192 RepID=UPI0018D55219|nr:translation initiation factor IF-2-like [Motacilla alba alba]